MDKLLKQPLLLKIILVILAAVMSAACALFCTLVCAEEMPAWVRVTEENVKLYTNANTGKVTCILEKSYYLEVLGETDGFYLVSVMNNTAAFPKITGYVKTDSVDVCTAQPAAPYYPNVLLRVDTDSAGIYFSPLSSAELILTAVNTQEMSYYGSIVSEGKTWYYVCYCGRFGYVPSENVTEPAVSLHPTPLPDLNPETPVVTPPSDSGDSQTPSASVAEILLIAFVAVLSVGLVLALFIPGNRRKKEENCFDKNL